MVAGSRALTEQGQPLFSEIDDCAKSVVARLHGVALGGGVELAHLQEIFFTQDALKGLKSVGGKTRPTFEGR